MVTDCNRMADQLYLSYWLRGFNEQNMLRQFEKMLALFPYSRLSQQGVVFRIIPLDYNQPAVFEQAYPSPPDLAAVLEAAKEFLHADSSYRLEASWDLWEREPDWRLAPVRAALCCFGPEFEHEPDDNLRLEFGIESLFLPEPGVSDSLKMVQSNIKSLLKLVHDVDDRLNAERRLLWSESGEDFYKRLERAVSGAGQR